MSGLVDEWAQETLEALSAKGLRRQLECHESSSGARIQFRGRTFLNFSSNDYLGLANDAELARAAAAGAETYGVGAGASRLVVGDSSAHFHLEQALARFLQVDASLVFASGYAANIGVLGALFGREDVLFCDALNHASLIDGARLSRAQVVVYPHGDVTALEALIRAHPGRRRAIVTDSVFSMDGDRAPVTRLSVLAQSFSLALIVDEAHATGVLGPEGRGLCALEGVVPDVHIGTLSKAVGAQGGFVAGSHALKDILVNRARTMVFSTGLSPLVCVAATKAVELLAQPGRREQLWKNIHQVARKLGLPPQSAIFPVIFGCPERALRAAQFLRDAGMVVKAIRPPTVPEGTSRLRICLSSAHSSDDVEALLFELGQNAGIKNHKTNRDS